MHTQNTQDLTAAGPVAGEAPTQTVTVQIGEQETRIPLKNPLRILIRLPRDCAVLETCSDAGQLVHTLQIHPR